MGQLLESFGNSGTPSVAGDFEIYLYDADANVEDASSSNVVTTVNTSSYVKYNVDMSVPNPPRIAAGPYLPGECKWFAYSPWTKEYTAPTSSSTSESSTNSSFGSLPSAGFLEIIKDTGDAGCHKTEKRQHAQVTQCVCAVGITVFDNFDFLDKTGRFVDGKTAAQRNFLMFQDAAYCQKPSWNMESAPQISHSGVPKFRSSEKCSVEIKTRSDASTATRDGAKTIFDGTLISLGRLTACLYSETASQYDTASGTGYPAKQERQCCTTSEYVFRRAFSKNNPTYTVYHAAMQSAVLLICTVNVTMAITAIANWHRWNRSSKHVFIAFIFPYAFGLVQHTVPAIIASDLLFRLMFELRKWFVLRGSQNETFLKRCDTGLLLPMNPDKAEAMRAKLQPANEDVLSPETIHAITRENNESYMARLKEIEERVDLKKAQREQQALVTAAQLEAAASGTMRPTETE